MAQKEKSFLFFFSSAACSSPPSTSAPTSVIVSRMIYVFDSCTVRTMWIWVKPSSASSALMIMDDPTAVVIFLSVLNLGTDGAVMALFFKKLKDKMWTIISSERQREKSTPLPIGEAFWHRLGDAAVAVERENVGEMNRKQLSLKFWLQNSNCLCFCLYINATVVSY